MALVDLHGPGPLFPSWIGLPLNMNSGSQTPALIANNSSQTADAVGDIAVMLGQVSIYGGGSKTISSSGGKIHFLPGTVTWAGAGTTVRIGIQDWSASGPPGRPDGSFDVYDDIVQGTDTLASATWKTVTMSSGTKTITDGDYIAICAEVTTRNGADVFRFAYINGSAAWSRPGGATFIDGAWSTGAVLGYLPIAIIEFDDGTLGTIDGSLPISGVGPETFNSGSSPDERGLIFQVQQPCKIDRVIACLGAAAATSDFTLTIYSDPLGTPTSMYSVNFTAEQLGDNAGNARANWSHAIPSASVDSFDADTDYAITITATGAGNVVLGTMSFADAAYRRFVSNGLNLRKGSRTDGSGALTEDTTIIPCIAMRFSALDDGSGGSGSGIGVLVGGGLAR